MTSAAAETDAQSAQAAVPARSGARPSVYGRILRLRHIHPNAWVRALFLEGSLAVGGLLVLADLASAWLIPVLPVAVAVVVKFHDWVAGALVRRAQAPPSGENA